MHRFFIPADWIFEGTVVITGKPVHQIRNVLRLGAGDRITVLDNSGCQYDVEIRKVDSTRVEGRVIAKSPAEAEPRTAVPLLVPVYSAPKTPMNVTGFCPESV